MTEQSQTEQPRRFRMKRGGTALIVAGLLAIGGTVGAVAGHHGRPAIEMAPAAPVAISSLSASTSDIITLRGRVTEVYGNKFILADASGRMLIDTGRGGEDGLVALNAPVTVQGRFDRGFVHASFLIGADGNVTALGPVGPGPHDRHGPPPPRPGDAPPPPPPGDGPPSAGPPAASAAPAAAPSAPATR